MPQLSEMVLSFPCWRKVWHCLTGGGGKLNCPYCPVKTVKQYHLSGGKFCSELICIISEERERERVPPLLGEVISLCDASGIHRGRTMGSQVVYNECTKVECDPSIVLIMNIKV